VPTTANHPVALAGADRLGGLRSQTAP